MAEDCDVGVDVEWLDRRINLGIADRYFAPSEVAYLQGVPLEERRSVFLRFWTLKESSVKALGTGFHYHDPLDVVCGAPRREKNGYVFTIYARRRLFAWTHRTGDEWVSIAADRCRNRSRS